MAGRFPFPAMGSAILLRMRTTLDIDDELMAALEARHPGMSKTDLIETALRAYLALSSNYELRKMAGSLELTHVRGGR